MNRPMVIYHANCYDGFTAAWVAWRKFGDHADYVPAHYGSPLPDVAWHRDLYILDFSYPRRVLEGRALDASHTLGATTLRVLDHHKTAEADLAGLSFCTFDMERSGCGLAWDFFFPNQPRPALVSYAEDRDLWRFALSGSREVSAWLRSYPFTFDAWNTAATQIDEAPAQVQAQGSAILRFQAQAVDNMCANASMRDVGGQRVPVVNASVFFSEVGERLCEMYPEAPFGAYYFDRKDGQRQWGARSRPRGFDVSAIAKSLGGGGHAAAAGWTETEPTP